MISFRTTFYLRIDLVLHLLFRDNHTHWCIWIWVLALVLILHYCRYLSWVYMHLLAMFVKFYYTTHQRVTPFVKENPKQNGSTN